MFGRAGDGFGRAVRRMDTDLDDQALVVADKDRCHRPQGPITGSRIVRPDHRADGRILVRMDSDAARCIVPDRHDGILARLTIAAVLLDVF